MNKIYGYARCSTNEEKQDINRQKRELYKLGVLSENDIYYEYESGAKRDRIELDRLLNIIEPSDTIATVEVSRLTRSTKHLCEILEIVKNKQIRLIIGNFVVDCRNSEIDPMTKGMLMMWGVFSEMEKDIISQRVKSGMANAKAKGSAIGRPKTTIENLPTSFTKYYTMYKAKKLNISELSKLSGLSRPTIYKYIEMIESK